MSATAVKPTYRENMPEMPDRIRALPVSEKGYPVPYFVAWIDGKPDFRVADPAKLAKCVNEKRCWVCGDVLGRYKAFVIGPMCAVNRVSSEPPAHRECAEFSAKACPFLTRPKAVRREAAMPEDAQDPAGIMLERNPGVALVWVTTDFRVVREGEGVLFRISDPVETAWYAEGRAATHEEVMASIKSGLPFLQELATRDGPDAVRALAHMTRVALQYVPEPVDETVTNDAPKSWFWLSFADPQRPKGEQFLGATIIEAHSFDAALRRAWHRGVNPGGEVRGTQLPDDWIKRVPQSYHGRVLTRAECQEIDAILADQGEAQ